MNAVAGLSFEELTALAADLDAADALAVFRRRFHLPVTVPGKDNVYLCGHSLGAQPREAPLAVQRILDEWATMGVGGFTSKAGRWMNLPHDIATLLAPLVGAHVHEVHPLNTLTVNLHLLMATFYRPTPQRWQILVEHRPFPSDTYAVQSQLAQHGFDPIAGRIELQPRAGESLLRTEDILDVIDRQGDSIALLLLGGVNYLSGQCFDMQAITVAAQQRGIVVGIDLAHAIGNVPVQLHDWGVDFAAWCSYKYLNSGPGAPGGIFIHERHHDRPPLARLAGWWGNDITSRFQMRPEFAPAPGASGWAQSTPTMLALAPLQASLQLFQEAGFNRLRAKSIELTEYLQNLLQAIPGVQVVTPTDPAQRGAMLCLRIPHGGRSIFDRLMAEGICCDWREPDIIRAAPAPLYNSYADCARFAIQLRAALQG